jgi:hypothetical protein
VRSRRTALTLTILALALVAAGVCAWELVPRFRGAMVGGFVKLAMDVPTEVDSAATAAVVRAPDEPLEPVDTPVSAAGAPAPQRRTAPQVAGAIDIPEDKVARLTEKQLRSLRPANVVGSDGVASGVRLHGVGALGVGLADADIVTSIDGRPTPDVSTGMDAVLRAWGSGEPAAHATVLRAGRTLRVTVHIPRHARVKPGLGPTAHVRNDDR